MFLYTIFDKYGYGGIIMKYLSVVFLFILILVMPVSYAINSEVDMGVLPGEVFYAFDLFFERIHLLFTFGPENKAEVLLSFAKERELELSSLDSDKRERFSEGLIDKRDNYIVQVRNNIDNAEIDDVYRQNILQEINKISGSEISDNAEVAALVDADAVILSDENDSGVIEQEEPEIKSIVKLSELQETACNAAEIGNTCNTRLPDLGLVTTDECCAALGKCC